MTQVSSHFGYFCDCRTRNRFDAISCIMLFKYSNQFMFDVAKRYDHEWTQLKYWFCPFSLWAHQRRPYLFTSRADKAALNFATFIKKPNVMSIVLIFIQQSSKVNPVVMLRRIQPVTIYIFVHNSYFGGKLNYGLSSRCIWQPNFVGESNTVGDVYFIE